MMRPCRGRRLPSVLSTSGPSGGRHDDMMAAPRRAGAREPMRVERANATATPAGRARDPCVWIWSVSGGAPVVRCLAAQPDDASRDGRVGVRWGLPNAEVAACRWSDLASGAPPPTPGRPTLVRGPRARAATMHGTARGAAGGSIGWWIRRLASCVRGGPAGGPGGRASRGRSPSRPNTTTRGRARCGG